MMSPALPMINSLSPYEAIVSLLLWKQPEQETHTQKLRSKIKQLAQGHIVGD